MKETNQSLVDFMLSKSPDTSYTQWIEKTLQQYEEIVCCLGCGRVATDIIIVPKTFIRCGQCHTRHEISIDKLLPINYNIVTFSYEDKIVDILSSANKIK